MPKDRTAVRGFCAACCLQYRQNATALGTRAYPVYGTMNFFVTCDSAHIRIDRRHALCASLQRDQLRRPDEARVIFHEYRFSHTSHFPQHTDKKEPARIAA